MSKEDEKYRILLRMLIGIRDGLVEVVNRINEGLEEIRKIEAPPEKPKELEIPDVIKALGDLAELVTIEIPVDRPNVIRVKPKTFLGSERFMKIYDIVRSLNGEYISAKKESHFLIPRFKKE